MGSWYTWCIEKNLRKEGTLARLASILIVTLTLGMIPATANAQWFDDWWFNWFEPIDPIIDPGWDLIGRDLNGDALDGEILDGRRITSVGLTKVWMDGNKLSATSLVHSKFYGVNKSGSAVSGQDFVGAEFDGHLDNNKKVNLRIDSMALHADAHNQDVYLYEVSYETKDGWTPLCGTGKAVPLNGRWANNGSWVNDSNAFTFACEDAAVGKCATHGYAPWRQFQDGTSLRDHHQACTRMMRADYCGDGTPHTVDGVKINFYDDYGVRVDSEAWTFEGEWGPDGATCVSASRLMKLNKLSCKKQIKDNSCGNANNFDDTTLLMSEFKPN